jgi:hypothetical protein
VPALGLFVVAAACGLRGDAGEPRDAAAGQHSGAACGDVWALVPASWPVRCDGLRAACDCLRAARWRRRAT